MPRTNRTKKPPPRRGRAQPETPQPAPVAVIDPDEAVDADGEYGRVEVRRRVEELLASGYAPALVVEQLMEQPIAPDPKAKGPQRLGGFGVSRATAWRYVKHIRAKWEALEPEERPFQRARCIRITEYGIRGAAEDREWSAFRGLTHDLAGLFGLHVSKVEVNEGGLDALIDALKATPPQRHSELDELVKEARGGSGKASGEPGPADAG